MNKQQAVRVTQTANLSRWRKKELGYFCWTLGFACLALLVFYISLFFVESHSNWVMLPAAIPFVPAFYILLGPWRKHVRASEGV